VLLRERPLKGLLGGMPETPSSPWEEKPPNGGAVADHAPLDADWEVVPGLVEHTFTHFHLRLAVRVAHVAKDAEPERGQFVTAREFRPSALPTVMRKAYDLAVSSLVDS